MSSKSLVTRTVSGSWSSSRTGRRPSGRSRIVSDLPQAIVSQHLAKMRGWDIVESRREGIHVYYWIIEPKVTHILDCIRHCDLDEQ